jgi:hypothetical protein
LGIWFVLALRWQPRASPDRVEAEVDGHAQDPGVFVFELSDGFPAREGTSERLGSEIFREGMTSDYPIHDRDCPRK